MIFSIFALLVLLPIINSQTLPNPPSFSSLPSLQPPSLSSAPSLPNGLPNGLPGPFGRGTYDGEYQTRVSLMDISTPGLWRVELIVPQAITAADVQYLISDKSSGYNPNSQQQQPGPQIPTQPDNSIPNPSNPNTPPSLNQSTNPTQYTYLMTALSGNRFVTNHISFSPQNNQLLWLSFTLHPNSSSSLSTEWTSFEGYVPQIRDTMPSSNAISDISDGSSGSFQGQGYTWITSVRQSNEFSTPNLNNIYALEIMTSSVNAISSPAMSYKVNAGNSKNVALTAKNGTVWWAPVILSPGDVLVYNTTFAQTIGDESIGSRIFVFRLPGYHHPQISDVGTPPIGNNPQLPANNLQLPQFQAPQINSPTLPTSGLPNMPGLPTTQSTSDPSSTNLFLSPSRWDTLPIPGGSTNTPTPPFSLPSVTNMPLPPNSLPSIMTPQNQSPNVPPISPPGTPSSPQVPVAAPPIQNTAVNTSIDPSLLQFTTIFQQSSSSMPGLGNPGGTPPITQPNPPSTDTSATKAYDIIFSSDWQTVGIQGLNYVILRYQINDGAIVTMQMEPQSATPINVGGPDFGVPQLPSTPSAPGGPIQNSIQDTGIFQQISISSTFQAVFRNIQLAPSDNFYYTFTYQPTFTNVQQTPMAITSTWYKYDISTNTSSTQTPPSSNTAIAGGIGPGLNCPMMVFDRNITLMSISSTSNAGTYNIIAYPKALQSQSQSQSPTTVSILSVTLHTATAGQSQQNTQMSMFANPLSFASSFTLNDFETVAYSFTYMIVPSSITSAATFCTSDSYSFVAPSTNGWTSSSPRPSVYFPSEITNIQTDPRPSGILNTPLSIGPTNPPIVPTVGNMTGLPSFGTPTAPTLPLNELPGLPFSMNDVGSVNVLSTNEETSNDAHLLPTIPADMTFTEDQMVRVFDVNPLTSFPSPLGSSNLFSLDTFSSAISGFMCYIPCVTASQTTALMTTCFGNCVQPMLPSGLNSNSVTSVINKMNDLFVAKLLEEDASNSTNTTSPSLPNDNSTSPSPGNLPPPPSQTIVSSTGVGISEVGDVISGPNFSIPQPPANPLQAVLSRPIPKKWPSVGCLKCYRDCEKHSDATVMLCSSGCWSFCMDEVAYDGQYSGETTDPENDPASGSTGDNVEFPISSTGSAAGNNDEGDNDIDEPNSNSTVQSSSIDSTTSTNPPNMIALLSSALGYTPNSAQAGLQSLSIYTQMSRYLSAVTALPAQVVTSPGTALDTVANTLLMLIGDVSSSQNGMPHPPAPSVSTQSTTDTPITTPVDMSVCSSKGFHTCLESCLIPLTEDYRLSLPPQNPLRMAVNSSYYISSSCAQNCFEMPCEMQRSITSNLVGNSTTADMRSFMRALELQAIINSLESREEGISEISSTAANDPPGLPTIGLPPAFIPPSASSACTACISKCPSIFSPTYLSCMTSCNTICLSGLGFQSSPPGQPSGSQTNSTANSTLTDLLGVLMTPSVPTPGFENELASSENILKMGSSFMMNLMRPTTGSVPNSASPLLSISSLPSLDTASYDYPLFNPANPTSVVPQTACENNASVVTMEACHIGCITASSSNTLGAYALCITACLNSNCLTADLNQLYGARSFRLLLQSLALNELNQTIGTTNAPVIYSPELKSLISQADFNLVPLETDPFASYGLSFPTAVGKTLPSIEFYFPSIICVRCSEYCWTLYESDIRSCMTSMCRYGCVVPSGVDGAV